MRSVTRRQVVFAVIAVAVVWTSKSAWLPWFGDFLVKTDEIRQADAILVLAGDASGNRIRTAAELAQKGLAPVVIVSGPNVQYGYNEADLAIGYATKQGFPESLFRPFRHDADSTREEARNVLRDPELSKLRSLIVVTSDYHTRRSGRTFRSTLKGMTIYMAAAPTEKFDPSTWWTRRPSMKVVSQEWTKTVADWLGI